MKHDTPSNCFGCGAHPNSLHEKGCTKEVCPQCGGQLYTCNCIYKVNGMGPDTLERYHPDVYYNGPTDEMQKLWDATVGSDNNRIPWTGYINGVLECQQLGWYATFGGAGVGWIVSTEDDPNSWEDLNRWYALTVWNPILKKRVFPEKPEQSIQETASTTNSNVLVGALFVIPPVS